MIYRIWETMNCTRHVGHLYAQVEFLGERMRERERGRQRELAASHSYLMISYILRAMNFKEHMFFDVIYI